jgi:hypothetical protein
LNDNSDDEDDDIQSMQLSMASMPTVSSVPIMMLRSGSNTSMPIPTSSKLCLEIKKNNADSRKMRAWLLREHMKGDPQGLFSTNSTTNAQWGTKQQEESLPSSTVRSPASFKPAWQLREQTKRRGTGLTPKSPKTAVDASTKLPPAFRQLYKATPLTPAKPKELIANQEWQKRKVQSKKNKGTVRESIAAWLDDDAPRTRVDVL